MQRNLAELAHAALTAASGAGPTPSPGGGRSVAGTCVRGDLGFALLRHRRKDGLVAEELYAAVRRDDGAWSDPDHLSGDAGGIDPDDAGEVARVLGGRALVPWGGSEASLYTGRPGSDEGYETVRFHALLVTPEADRLDVRDDTPGTGPARWADHGGPVSRVALFALFPGERFTVRAVAGTGARARALGEPYALAGVDPGDEDTLPEWLAGTE
ncbi:hypothetical protein VM636_19685 [Streptomyces sp. SCSIO 75703]|uniref:hypothetical protein n=1 Tax=unclassified Streptomyces TaxID=2593676 RepID=UPI00068F554D|nr:MULTISPECIES: hypothetical protein [unclassified Streptomyces]